MTFPLVRVAGFTDGTRLPATELNTWQGYTANSLDAIGGGSYAMTAPIVFTGSTWSLPATTFTGTVTCAALTASGTVTCNGNVVLGNASGDALTVNATSEFNGNVECDGDVVLGTNAANTLTVYATSDFASACEFHAAVTFDNTVTVDTLTSAAGMTVNNAVGFTGAVTCASTVNLNGNTNIGNASGDALIVTATTRFDSPVSATARLSATVGVALPSVLVIMTDADASLDYFDGNYLYVPGAVLGADRVVTLGTVDVPAGAIIRATTKDATQKVTVEGLDLRLATGVPYYAEWVFTGSTWQLGFSVLTP